MGRISARRAQDVPATGVESWFPVQCCKSSNGVAGAHAECRLRIELLSAQACVNILVMYTRMRTACDCELHRATS